MSTHDSLPRATSWRDAVRTARERGYGKNVKLSKRNTIGIPARFEPSRLSITAGANAVYRDQQAKDSIQIREYDDYYTVELDRYNPEQGYPIQHAAQDAPKYTALALGIVAAVAGAGS
jgi:hypothetical protein